MKNKYFTPDIENFHVGYEFEMKVFGEKTWLKMIFSTPDFTSVLNKVEENYSVPKVLRVPYLTKEQIEAEGWTYYQNIPDMVVPEGYVEYYKDVEWFKVVISISETSHYLTVEKVFQNVQIGDELQEFRNTIYNGECKDINTFRKIIKLLGI